MWRAIEICIRGGGQVPGMRAVYYIGGPVRENVPPEPRAGRQAAGITSTGAPRRPFRCTRPPVPRTPAHRATNTFALASPRRPLAEKGVARIVEKKKKKEKKNRDASAAYT